MPHIDKQNARELQLRSAASRRANAAAARARAAELKALATLSAAERARLAADELAPQAVERLRELVEKGDAEQAVKAFLAWYDRAHPRPAAQVEVRAGPLDVDDVPTEQLAAQLEELRRARDGHAVDPPDGA